MSMTPAQLLAIARELVDSLPPNARLEKNMVGNLAIVVNDEYVGFVNLRYAEVPLFSDED